VLRSDVTATADRPLRTCLARPGRRRFVSPRTEFDLQIDTIDAQGHTIFGTPFHVVVPEKSYSVATESQFKLRWLPDIEKAIVSAQNGSAVSTIKRTGGPSWEADGFRAGQSIDVSGAGLNDGAYTIDSIDGDTLTLAEDLKATGTDADAKVEGPGTASLPADQNWNTLGYKAGQRVTISGSTRQRRPHYRGDLGGRAANLNEALIRRPFPRRLRDERRRRPALAERKFRRRPAGVGDDGGHLQAH
jgi:hypothetical protein